MDIYYVHGEFVAEDQAHISVNDLSVIRGFGVFDFLRTYNGVPFHLDDHLKRLERSARLIGLKLPHSRAEIKGIVEATLARNDHQESNIRIVVTGGLSSDGITPGDSPRLLVMVTEVKKMPAQWYTSGAKVITSHVDRFMPGAKSINYIPAILCQNEARNQQAIEAIYVDRNGFLLEGTTSNFFAFIGDALITPPCDRVLPGITRQVVLTLAEKEFPIVERQLHKDEIRLLDEVFLASSVREVVPIVHVDSIQVGDGRPGSRTQRIMQLFRDNTVSFQG
ncbi:branched-chain amino acid aminotransferase [Desulfopila sp. IMCC35006]|uniref:aminotransferase class IV n=1 Tax=Desulfopila sp. IMCC35006 TaxID=2569542 RepID=UPI0010ABFFEE|nr:aminotransferase class IV [Desulfopila sp. IMCC35006]TKB25607.1 branched-chain amino acid aminotransferase [Desulfopila sp. IMCC35006]